MHNQHIVDIKEIGERVLPFAIKREEPVLLYHQHQDQYRAPDTDYSRAQSRSRSPPSKRHRPDNRDKRRDPSPRPRVDKTATDSTVDTRHSTTTTTRPHNMLCYRCGKKHGTGRAMALANAGTSVDLKNRWSHSEKRMVPLEASVYLNDSNIA
jgi:hypothetical protein